MEHAAKRPRTSRFLKLPLEKKKKKEEEEEGVGKKEANKQRRNLLIIPINQCIITV